MDYQIDREQLDRELLGQLAIVGTMEQALIVTMAAMQTVMAQASAEEVALLKDEFAQNQVKFSRLATAVNGATEDELAIALVKLSRVANKPIPELAANLSYKLDRAGVEVFADGYVLNPMFPNR